MTSFSPPTAAWSAAPQLGARWDGAGTAFAVYSAVAANVELCLLEPRRHNPGGRAPEDGVGQAHGNDADPSARGRSAVGEPQPERRVTMRRRGHVWSTYVPGVGPGQAYGFRVQGPFPADPSKLLIDPYATAIDGHLRWGDDLVVAGRDDAAVVPHALVTSPYFDWGADERRPRVPWSDTVIYEAHVKGLTATHPDLPAQDRGTFRGLAHPAVLEHLRRLGVTTVELLPVHHFIDERHAAEQRLTNYWGYNSLGFFAPHGGYAATKRPGGQVGEFKAMVRQLHQAGLEVVLDVVYNHTAEGGGGGPLLSWRGLDPRAYYRLAGGDPSVHVDWSGCGNTLDVDQPAALRLVLDSLRYWVAECHVDGFRFDLAPVLGRDGGRFDSGAAFFDALYQDPLLSDVKLIAEPWDLGPDGYRLGGFPAGWAEWNGHFRDTARDFWRGRPATIGLLAGCLAGSAGVFGDPARGPLASVNFVTCHDGFTLADLVSYAEKHNEANGEDNRDGTDDNRSWNCGVEGPTDEPAVRTVRARQQRNLLATLLLSHGVPMLSHGDELGRTQHGNNNAYCQDNELSWVDWSRVDQGLVSFVARLTELRRAHPVLRRASWATGLAPSDGAGVDMSWYTPRGQPMGEEQWLDPGCRAVVVVLDGRAADQPMDNGDGYRHAERAEGAEATSMLIMINGSDHRLLCRIPLAAWPGRWRRVLDSAEHGIVDRRRRYLTGEQIRLEPSSLVVLTGVA